MFNKQSGYTLVELMVVMAVIAIIGSLVLVFIPDARQQARDKERQGDIDTLHSRLEDYYQDKGAYPSTISITIFPRLDPESLKDPNNNSIRIDPPVANQQVARASMNPESSGSEYSYTPYPNGCTSNCVGYILKTYIEVPNNHTSNPYIRGGLNNN